MELASVEDAIADIRAGKFVIIVDDEDRENEGDLCIAAEKITPEAVNFMARFGRGLVCLALTEERCRDLDLPLMVEKNTSNYGTAFTVSIEARGRVTTGISAHDRSETVRVAIYLATETARQCGPCVHGTAAIARTLQGIAEGRAPSSAFADLQRWTSELPGRGACHHPNGLAHFVATALETFPAQFAEHARRGPCRACAAEPVLGVPATRTPGR